MKHLAVMFNHMSFSFFLSCVSLYEEPVDNVGALQRVQLTDPSVCSCIYLKMIHDAEAIWY